jgi:hypothetical protein
MTKVCIACGDTPDPSHEGLGMADEGTWGGLSMCGDAHVFRSVSRTWVLGASDPEMTHIFHLLHSRGECVQYAMVDGSRVRPDTAYRAVPPSGCDGTVYAVECSWPQREGEEVIIVDHHRPGDPGYGVPPAEYQRGSSLGQVIGILGAEWDPHSRMAAAADHCLAAAYRGECPEVNPDALLKWRAASRGEFQHRSIPAVLSDIAAAQRALQSAPRVSLLVDCCGGHSVGPYRDPECCEERARSYVADMRGRHVPELPEAAARLGLAFIADAPAEGEARRKVVLQVASPAQLAAWPAWAARNGIVDLYGGDPARGFAGGYQEVQS